MEAHPILDSPRRWLIALLLALLAAMAQTALLVCYANADLLAGLMDGMLSTLLLGVLAYLSWFVIGFVSMLKTDVLVAVLALLFWLAGGFAIQETLEQVLATSYTSFSLTLPFRLVFGVLCWVIVMLWYRLQTLQGLQTEEGENADPEFLVEPVVAEVPVSELALPLVPLSNAQSTNAQFTNVQSAEDCIDRITVKDGSRIHLISTSELLYIEACGDYVTLVTPQGQYIKEQTMKYLEAHLPVSGFVRIHRSTIVNVTQISRVELFGKENYQLLLKSGVKLRVSNSGYRLLKERLEL